MQIRTFEAFVEIIRQSGFSAAAKKLNATQSTISKALAQLENYYDVRLINRGQGKLQLTSAGEYIYLRALRIIAEEQAIHQDIADLKGLKRGILKIGLPPIGSAEFFAPVLANYTASYPHVDMHIVEHGSKKLEELVRIGEIELAASLYPIAEGFDYQDVRNEPLVALVPNINGEKKKKMSMSELAKFPLVLFETEFALTPIIVDAFNKIGLDPVISARTRQIDFLFGLVGAGMGVGFLPRMIAEKRSVANVRIVEISDIVIEWHMVLVWQQRHHLSYAAREWLRLAKDYNQQGKKL